MTSTLPSSRPSSWRPGPAVPAPTSVAEPRDAAPADGPTTATGAARALVTSVDEVVQGRHAVVERVVAAVLARGHVLVEDVPGTGKTTLARALAQAVGVDLSRVQATADLMPADVTGAGVWRPEAGLVEFVPGPLFGHVVLADELNRTPPRTQSAFMEAMEERAVTVDGVRHPLPDPFVVVATQNPLDQAGTYPLPEGQLDRFAVRLRLGRVAGSVERAVLRSRLHALQPEPARQVLDAAGLRRLQAHVVDVHVADAVLDLAVGVVAATREHPRVALGASTRGALTLVRVAQALALLRGRDHVLPDDVQVLAADVLAHRLVLRDGGRDAADVVAAAVASVPVGR